MEYICKDCGLIMICNPGRCTDCKSENVYTASKKSSPFRPSEKDHGKDFYRGRSSGGSSRQTLTKKFYKIAKVIYVDDDGDKWYGCHYCKHLFIKIDMTLDHKLALFSGGKNTMKNLVPCCVYCNREKGSGDYTVYKKLKSQTA